MVLCGCSVEKKNLVSQEEKLSPPSGQAPGCAGVYHAVLVAVIIWSSSSELNSGSKSLPLLTLKSSSKSGSFHIFSSGVGKYLIILAVMEVREPLSTLQSAAILLTVLPSVILSLKKLLARYLTLLLLQV